MPSGVRDHRVLLGSTFLFIRSGDGAQLREMEISGRVHHEDKSVWPEGDSKGSPFPGELQRVAFYSLLGGASALIPVPFLDDWAWNWVRRRMAVEVIKGITLQPGHPAVRGLFLSPSRGGCLSNALVSALIAPFRLLVYLLAKFFRKVFFVLAILDASSRASRTFHEGYLLSQASVEGSAIDQAEALRHLSEVLSGTLARLDMSPIRNVFRSVFRLNRNLLKRAAGILKELRRGLQPEGSRQALEEAMRREAELLGQLADDTSAAVLGQKGYLDQVASRFMRELENRGLLVRMTRKSEDV